MANWPSQRIRKDSRNARVRFSARVTQYRLSVLQAVAALLPSLSGDPRP